MYRTRVRPFGLRLCHAIRVCKLGGIFCDHNTESSHSVVAILTRGRADAFGSKWAGWWELRTRVIISTRTCTPYNIGKNHLHSRHEARPSDVSKEWECLLLLVFSWSLGSGQTLLSMKCSSIQNQLNVMFLVWRLGYLIQKLSLRSFGQWLNLSAASHRDLLFCKGRFQFRATQPESGAPYHETVGCSLPISI